jgi:reactive intermediate/imine deaminase
MPKQVVTTPQVVEGKNLYSQCIRSGSTLYVSGQVGWDREGNIVGKGDAAVQARRCFEGMKALVEAGGGTMDDIVKVNMYLTNVADAAGIRAVRQEFFRAPFPAWTTVAVSALVHPDLLVEIEAIAELK